MRITIITTLAALALLACKPSPAGPPVRTARDACYDEADAAAQRRIDGECPGSFTSCPSANEIFADLRREQEKCP
jgi:hypothetical protein